MELRVPQVRRLPVCISRVDTTHKCPHCQVSMHPFCGLRFGAEGFGQPVICKVCQQTNGVPAGNAADEGNAMDEDAALPPPPRRAVRAASAGVNNAVAAVHGGQLATKEREGGKAVGVV